MLKKKERVKVKEPEDPRRDVFSALACSRRIQIVELLRDGEKCASEIIPILGIDQSAVSRHLSILKKAGILASRKKGVNVYYRIATESVFTLLEVASEIVEKKNKELLKKLKGS